MKKVLAIVAAVAVVSSVASAQLLKNFKLDGSSLEINAYNLNNADFNDDNGDKKGDVDTRLMLNMSFDLNDDANAVVTLVKNNRQWGTNSENINDKDNKGILNNIYVEQAYINLKGVLGMDHKLGRQFYGNPGDLVIYYGPKMWPYQPTFGIVNAIDAWVGTYNYKDWTFTGIMGKEKRNKDNLGNNLSGIDIKKKIDRFNLNAYYYYKVDNTTTTPNTGHLGLYGFRANWECRFVEGLNLGLEYNHNAGSDNSYKKYKGYAYKVNAGYTTDKAAGKLGLNAEYVYLSGDNNPGDTDNETYTSIADDYRPGIIYGGNWIDWNTYYRYTGDGDKIIKLGLNWTPEKLNKLNLAFDYINFKAAEKETNMTEDTLGNEYDIVATWNHSDKVSLKGYYAMFEPEKKNLIGITDDMETMLGAAFVVKF